LGYKRNGEWETFHSNGKLEMSGLYEDGERVGEWKSYNENDLLIDSYDLTNNMRKLYYENGQVKQEGLLINKKQIGEWNIYNLCN